MTGVAPGSRVVLLMVRCGRVVIVGLMACNADFFISESVYSGCGGVAGVTTKTRMAADGVRVVP